MVKKITKKLLFLALFYLLVLESVFAGCWIKTIAFAAVFAGLFAFTFYYGAYFITGLKMADAFVVGAGAAGGVVGCIVGSG